MNVVEPILFQCKFNRPALAICTPGSAVEALTYGELETSIHNVARTALSRGLAPGMIVAIVAKDALFGAMLTLGLMRLGVVVLATDQRTIPSGLHVDAMISDEPFIPPGGQRLLVADRGWAEGDGKPLNYDRLHQCHDDDLCAVLLTSGTTGEPKAVGLTHGLESRRIAYDLYAKGPRFLQCTRMYCDFRIGTAPGFRNMTTRLWSGGTIYFWGGDSSALLRAFDRHKIQNISSAPVGLSQFAQAFETDRAMAPHLDHVICQGAPLPKELAARIRAAVCENLYCLYASTEAGNVAFAPADLLEATPGSVGYVEPGVTVQIVDDADQIVPNGRQGKVRVRSPLLVSGYLNAPEVTAKVFRDGFFYPGDLGYLTPDRMLIVNGREDTVLNFGGHKTTPEAVEDVLMNFSGIQQAAVFSMPDASGIDVPWALIVTKSPLNEAALRTHCAKTLTDISVPARFIVVDEIPRSPAGKIERHRLRDWAERQDVARTGA